MSAFLTWNEERSVWQDIGESIQGVSWNAFVGAASFCTATGTHMWINGLLYHNLHPEPHSITDIALNGLACFSSAIMGGYVGESIGYSAVPLASAAGITINPEWIGLLGATASATTAAWMHHCRVEAKKGKK